MGLDGFEVNWAHILKRHIAPSNESSLERCEVLVSHEKPLELKFNKTSEVLIIKFHYGYWNVSGILKHWTNRWYITGSIGFNHMWTNLTWHINFSRLFFCIHINLGCVKYWNKLPNLFLDHTCMCRNNCVIKFNVMLVEIKWHFV